MNSMSLKAKINQKAKELEVMPQYLLQMYFFERLLYRISASRYRDNFILKGGLLLAAIFGEDRRTTQDMDTMIKGLEIEPDSLLKVFKEILSIKTDDGIIYEIKGFKDIRLEDKYGGIRLAIVGCKEDLRVNLKIDITTKDPITPREIEFKYKSMFDDNYIKIMAFTKETIIAEKFETLIEDTENDTRAKDFYDISILMNEEINEANLRKAIFNTFKRREREYLLDELDERYEFINTSEILKSNWANYQNGHPYALNVSYDDIMGSVFKIINIIKEIK